MLGLSAGDKVLVVVRSERVLVLHKSSRGGNSRLGRPYPAHPLRKERQSRG